MRREPSVLAIGLDSFDAKLARRLMESNVMPNLRALLETGRWAEVGSVAHIGSGAVWPTFVTGTPPHVHGRYGEWRWHPDEMDVKRFSDEGLRPFWEGLVEDDVPIGIFDVPFAPFLQIKNGFEVNEWGAHDVLRGNLLCSPRSAAETVARRKPHPFEFEPPIPEDAHDRDDLKLVHEVCVQGVKDRGDLLLELLKEQLPRLVVAVFPEFHHAAHYLWHAVEPEHPLFRDARLQEVPDLIDVCVEIDNQLGRLVERFGDNDPVIVFSLHGMRASLGIPDLIAPLLKKAGLAKPASWNTRTWPERKSWAFGLMKKKSPSWIKDLYHRRAGLMTQLKLARSTMQEHYDWSNTEAISLPTDQHGWARINLRGREIKGTVSPDRYMELCLTIKDLTTRFRTIGGDALVDDVLIPFEGDDPTRFPLPDVIVHWSDASFPDDMRPADPDHYAPKVAKSRTGQHNTDGFCIATGTLAEALQDEVATEDLSRIILGALK